MATPTYDLLDSTTLASSASSVTFSSISQDFRDLVLVVAGDQGASSPDIVLELNTDTNSANYANVNMRGDGSSTYSGSGFRPKRIGTCANDFNFITQFLDYSATDKHKTYLSRVNDTGSNVWAAANRWANTSAITEVKVVADGTTWASGISFYLYGISA